MFLPSTVEIIRHFYKRYYFLYDGVKEIVSLKNGYSCFLRFPRLSVYIATVTVKPSGRQQTDKERGAFLLRQTIKWALFLNRQSDIKNWYGIGATKEGQHLFESLGFQEIVSLYDGERKGYRAQDIKQPVKLINRLLAELNKQNQEDTKKQESMSNLREA